MAGSRVPESDGSQGPRLSAVPRAVEEAILAALGDAQARAIMLYLNREARSVQDTMQACALPQASVYRKLRDLQEAGLVGIQRSALSPEGHRTDLFRSLLVGVHVRYGADRLEVTAAFRDLAAERFGDLWEQVRGGRKK